MIDPKTKRRYNMTYQARKKGLEIDSRQGIIYAYMEDLSNLIQYSCIRILCKEYNYKFKQNRQLKIPFNHE